MKNHKTVTRVLVALIAGAGLAGCAVVPAYGPDYGPQVYGPPVLVVPSIGIGFHGGGHSHRGHRGRRGHR